MLEVKDLSIHFGGVKAVQNVTFQYRFRHRLFGDRPQRRRQEPRCST